MRRAWGAGLVLSGLLLTGCGTVDWPAQVPEATLPAEAAGGSVTSGTVDAGEGTDPSGATGAGESASGESATGEGATGDAVDEAALADLASAMTQTLQGGTEDDWAAYFDGDDDLVAAQRRWFRGVQAVPMDVREMRPGAVVETDADGGTVVDLTFVHQVSGADPVPGAEAYRATVRPSPDGEPRITEIGGEEGEGGYPQLWDLDEIAVTVTPRLVVIAPADRSQEAADVLSGLENATVNVFLDFDAGPRERLVVQLVEAEDLRAIAVDDDLAVDPAGVAMTLATQEAGEGRTGEHVDRIVLDLDVLVGGLAFGSPAGGWGLMRHEGVHAVVDGDPEVSPPVWVWEGLAEWYGFRRDYLVEEAYRGVVGAVVASGEPLELPDSFDDYYYESQEAGELAYASSAMVFTFLEQRFGFETARDVGVRLTETDTWGDSAEADRLLLELIGMTLADLEQQWADWAVATYG